MCKGLDCFLVEKSLEICKRPCNQHKPHNSILLLTLLCHGKILLLQRIRFRHKRKRKTNIGVLSDVNVSPFARCHAKEFFCYGVGLNASRLVLYTLKINAVASEEEGPSYIIIQFDTGLPRHLCGEGKDSHELHKL